MLHWMFKVTSFCHGFRSICFSNHLCTVIQTLCFCLQTFRLVSVLSDIFLYSRWLVSWKYLEYFINHCLIKITVKYCQRITFMQFQGSAATAHRWGGLVCNYQMSRFFLMLCTKIVRSVDFSVIQKNKRWSFFLDAWYINTLVTYWISNKIGNLLLSPF